MREISVSNRVYSIIWSQYREGDPDENAILERLLSPDAPTIAPVERTHPDKNGLYDPKNGVLFHEKFRIYRNYKGAEHWAVVENGSWNLDDYNPGIDSLNQLNRAIGAMTENAWTTWYYDDENGHKTSINNLRDPSKIQKKKESATEE